MAFSNGADGKDADVALAERFHHDELDLRYVVDRRDGIRHTGHGRETPHGRGRRAGGDCFLFFLAGFAQVHMNINQTGRHDQIGRIEHLHLFGRLDRFGDFLNMPAFDQDVEQLIPLVARVDDMTAADQERPPGLRRLARTLLSGPGDGGFQNAFLSPAWSMDELVGVEPVLPANRYNTAIRMAMPLVT